MRSYQDRARADKAEVLRLEQERVAKGERDAAFVIERERRRQLAEVAKNRVYICGQRSREEVDEQTRKDNIVIADYELNWAGRVEPPPPRLRRQPDNPLLGEI